LTLFWQAEFLLSITHISRRQFCARFSRCKDKERSNFLPWWKSAWVAESSPLFWHTSVNTSASNECRETWTETRCPLGQRTVALLILYLHSKMQEEFRFYWKISDHSTWSFILNCDSSKQNFKICKQTEKGGKIKTLYSATSLFHIALKIMRCG